MLMRADLTNLTNMPALRQPATYDDLLPLPEHLVAEIIDGDLYTSPRPGAWEAHAKGGLLGELFLAFEKGQGGPGGWEILGEPEFHFGADIVVPDITGWRRERMPRFPDVAFFTLAPDWVCEVPSAVTARVDRAKLDVYAREGVPYLWLMDPFSRTIEILRLTASRNWENHETFTAAHDRMRAVPFDAVDIELDLIWDGLTTTKQEQEKSTEP